MPISIQAKIPGWHAKAKRATMSTSKVNPAIVPVPHGLALMPGGILPGFFFLRQASYKMIL